MINSKPSRFAAIAAFSMVACLFFAGPALAESHNLQVTVPFAFYVGGNLLPAGSYDVTTVSNAVRFQNTGTRESAAIMTHPLQRVSGVVPSASVVLTKYGDDYFLSELWWGAGTSAGSMLMMSEHETELAKTFRPIRIEAIARR